jgi:hypothetical protein
MDIYNIAESGADNAGFFTAGDAKVLALVCSLGTTVQNLTGATFQTFIPAEDGSTLVIPNASHALGTPTLGEVNLTISAANGKLIKRQKKVPFMTKVTIAGTTISYWGEFSEVRQPIV